jgi:protein-tyrosine-phosphatase/predicted ATP-grasp superfamily ATP-dependent carboligase
MRRGLKGLSILVTDADNLPGLGAIRSLGRAGYRVIAGYPTGNDRPAGAWSRYWRAELCYPSPRLKHFEFREWLQDQARRGTFDVILPVAESSVVAVASVRNQLPDGFLAIVPSDSALLYTLSKFRSTQEALMLGIPCPATVFISDGTPDEQWNCDLSSLRFPIIIKTDNHLTDNGTYVPGQHFVAVDVKSAKELLWKLESRNTRIIAQELIAGTGAGTFYLKFGGKTYMRFAHRRLHEIPYTGGTSSLRESVHDDELTNLGEILLDAIGYEGVAMVEFRRSASDLRPYFLEINGRLWGSLALALHCGIDFPKYLIQCYEGNDPFPDPPRYRAGVKCRNIFPGELSHLFSVLRARPGKGVERRPSKTAAVVKFAVLSFDPRVRHDYFWWSDPLPGIKQAGRTLAYCFSRIIHKTIGRYREHRKGRLLQRLKAEHKMRSIQPRYFPEPVKQVTFLCYGNICRSPFAEYFWNTMRQHCSLNCNSALSAGFQPETGRRSPVWASDLAAEYGIDMSRHRSRTLTRQMVESADANFVMDHTNYYDLVAHFPSVRDKTYLLGLFADESWIEIDDPYFLGKEDARVCYRRLVQSLEGLVRRIVVDEGRAPISVEWAVSRKEQNQAPANLS